DLGGRARHEHVLQARLGAGRRHQRELRPAAGGGADRREVGGGGRGGGAGGWAAQPGGKWGGGAALTPRGEELIRHYRAIERKALSATASHLKALQAISRKRRRKYSV